MASFSIEKRTTTNGETRYRCKVIVKQGGAIIHRESKTFSKKDIARQWGNSRLTAIENGELSKGRVITIGKMLDLFINDKDLWNKTGRTKAYVIKMLRDCQIANIYTHTLKVSDLIEHCRMRRDSLNYKGEPVSGATIYHDIAYLRSVMKIARPVFNINANVSVFEEAVPVLIDMGLIAKSQKRTRRPTENELTRLKRGLLERQNTRGAKIPFIDILDFSILTCMRIGEVCKIEWEDLNVEHKTVLVRDRKDPRKKEGNHMIVPLLGGAFDIAMKQAQINKRIFPFDSRSVTAGFQRVRNALGINDLRYHDLRREGASRLFELGYSIEEVAQVTGHRNLNILWQVYTQLFPHKLHEKFLNAEEEKTAI